MAVSDLTCRETAEAAGGWDYGGSAVRELAIIAGLVVAGWWVVPPSLYVQAAAILPVVYVLVRDHTRLFLFVSTALVVSAPASITGEPGDTFIRNANLLALTPLYFRLVTWRDRTGRWDALDPLVIFTAPFWFLGLPGACVRLLDVLGLPTP
jgi:hypothetical protein